MARFAAGDAVIATKNRPGIVKSVYPARITPTYAVALDGQTNPEIFYERELRAQSAAPSTAIHCRDCGNQSWSNYAPGVVRCTVFKQFRSAGAPRQCENFSPLKPGG